jgi:hypothetical protein
MHRLLALSFLFGALAVAVACDSDDSSDDADDAGNTALDLTDVAENPDDYEWFDFRPNLLKLILAGAAETEHIAILWYTVTEGAVGLHYHSKTESVYVIDGTQMDAKGVYETGTVYFNPPTSGHAISDSSGFFLLAYASPPDFMGTDMIEEYTPIRLDTDAEDLTTAYEFEEVASDVRGYAVPLDDQGGLSADFIETTSTVPYGYVGNYVLVLKGTCDIDGEIYGENMLVVTKTIAPRPYELAALEDGRCLAMGVSF